MVYDLLNIENDIVEFNTTDNTGNKKNKKIIINNEDELWATYKFKHISEAMNGITSQFNDFVKNNSTAKM